MLIGAAVAGLGVALGRGPHVAPLLARGQLVRVTQESWRAPWSYFLVAPAAHFRRPVVRAFVDWALAEARDDGGVALGAPSRRSLALAGTALRRNSGASSLQRCATYGTSATST